MSLTNLSFIGVYLPLMLIAYYNPIIKNNIFRKIILILASLGLYTFSEPIYVLLLISIIISNYGLVKISDKANRKIYRIIAILLDVTVLLSFKYINAVLPLIFVNNSIGSIVFPIGLSYFTFKAISYVVDSNKVKSGNIIDVAIYISNFLTIVSGPLSTYEDELPYIREKVYLSEENILRGIERFIIGFGKKVIIADSLGVLVSQCFLFSDLSVTMAWVGAIGYTLQLFFDFSGYTDMTLGVGLLFGFKLPENFNYPYMASSISDFWKRWHISLTKWFTKYIYFPLGGSRVKSTARHLFNLFVVWAVTGMWHGSTMTFIIWAMIYFVLQLIEKYTKWNEILKKNHLAHIYTLVLVVVEWVIFRSSSVSSAVYYIKSMFYLNGNTVINHGDLETILKYIIPLLLGVVFSTNIGLRIKRIACNNLALYILYNLGLVILLGLCIIISIGQGYSAPLYAEF